MMMIESASASEYEGVSSWSPGVATAAVSAIFRMHFQFLLSPCADWKDYPEQPETRAVKVLLAWQNFITDIQNWRSTRLRALSQKYTKKAQ